MTHLALVESVRGATDREAGRSLGRIAVWGCDDGADVAALAPFADEIVGIDSNPGRLDACRSAVDAVCVTPFRPLLVDPADPLASAGEIARSCDRFVKLGDTDHVDGRTPERRILLAAHRVLVPRGIAVVRVRHDARPGPDAVRRFRPAGADRTLAELWRLARSCGFRPLSLQLIPRGGVGDSYAYLPLMKLDGASYEPA